MTTTAVPLQTDRPPMYPQGKDPLRALFRAIAQERPDLVMQEARELLQEYMKEMADLRWQAKMIRRLVGDEDE